MGRCEWGTGANGAGRGARCTALGAFIAKMVHALPAPAGQALDAGARVALELPGGDTIVLGRNEGGGDGVILESGAEGMSALFLAGKPLREPISRHGPFVMNTREEIMQAFMDYQNGTLVRHKGTMVDFEGKDEL